MKVRAKSVYVYHPCLLDIGDARTGLKSGDKVRVVNLHGCPPCNTMGHAHVEHPDTAEFIGLVCTGSLHMQKAYDEYKAQEAAKAK